MGSNRVVLAPATLPMQTHAPSELSSHSMPAMELSSSIKMEPLPVDAAMTHCHSENWAESYQDLSSWCSATSASSPATCISPVTDESAVGDTEFLGEIDFDLRKSEEIASVPLEEDNSFILWGAGSELSTSPIPPVQADTGGKKSDCVLLKDCWWSEVDEPKAVKELEANRPQVASAKNLLATVTVKKEVIDTKENMNPRVANQPFLADPEKMDELRRRCERLASLTHPGVDTSAKAADMMWILQGKILGLNRKRHRSPAAVSDLHNYSKLHLPSTSTSTAHTQSVQTATVPQMTDIFKSDPFEGFFPATDSQSHQVQEGNQFEIPTVTVPSNQPFPQIMVIENHQPVQGVAVPDITRGSDLFIEAHQEIMRHAPKPSQLPNQQQFPALQQGFLTANQPVHAPSTTHSHHSAPAKGGLTIQLPPPRLPELDLDSLLFGSPVVVAGLGAGKVQALSTPEVFKNLVETPDADSFDLLSYLCDDKPTPPVSLDSNPFHFQQLPQPSIPASVIEHKPNIMVVKPLSPQWAKETNVKRNETSPVVVEMKPQIMPTALSDVEEEDENQLRTKEDEKRVTGKNLTALKETLASSRPSRSSRKRKYSEEEFELSPTISEEKPKSSRSRRRNSSKYDSDEEFLPVKKSRKKSVSAIEDEEEDEQKVKRAKAAPSVKRGERSVSTSSDSDRYRELRDRNNEASRKSRLSRKAREQELSLQAEGLIKDNRVLKVKVEEMEQLVKRLREALLHSMMNKKP